MPKIKAATVKEHHEIVFDKLVNAAEDILRRDGGAALTAGAVAEQAGIARNSIYRYVKSVDDLRLHVLDRYLPIWTEAVNSKVSEADSPETQLLAVLHESLVMAQSTGHSWLISVMRSAHTPKGGPDTRPKQHGVAVTPAINEFHKALLGRIHRLWAQIDPQLAPIKARLTMTLIEQGMTLLDSGVAVEDAYAAVSAALIGMLHT